MPCQLKLKTHSDKTNIRQSKLKINKYQSFYYSILNPKMQSGVQYDKKY